MAACAYAPAALALNGTNDSEVTVLSGQACPPDRTGGGTSLNCTANEFVATATSTSNTITACQIGHYIGYPGAATPIDLLVGLTSKVTDRYDVGFFADESGFSPNANDTDNNGQGSGTCAVATFPTTDADPANLTGWFQNAMSIPANTCGDLTGGGSTDNLVHGVFATCQPDASGSLAIPFMITYAQGKSDACTGPSDVNAGATSKCDVVTVSVTNVTVQYNANPTCTFAGAGDGIVYDPVANTVTKTFTLTNNGPDDAGPPGSNAISFSDVVPSPITVQTAVCQNPQGGAACPAGPLAIDGGTNTVTGTLPTMPNGGSVDIVITGDVPPLSTATFNNSIDITVDTALIITPPNWVSVGACSAGATLPVKLQSFDVK
jgi:hypothetical protein